MPKSGEKKDEIEESEEEESDKTLYLLSLLLKIIEYYVKTVPTLVAQAGFELTRLIDDIVPWNGNDTALTALDTLKSRISTIAIILNPVIRALKYATSGRKCKWFGSPEDCIKLITQVVVMQDWQVAVKKSPLAKLLLLANCGELEEIDEELYQSIRQLIKTILKQSGILSRFEFLLFSGF